METSFRFGLVLIAGLLLLMGSAFASALIVNNTLGGAIDMSNACAVNPPSNNSGTTAGGGLNGY